MGRIWQQDMQTNNENVLLSVRPAETTCCWFWCKMMTNFSAQELQCRADYTMRLNNISKKGINEIIDVISNIWFIRWCDLTDSYLSISILYLNLISNLLKDDALGL